MAFQKNPRFGNYCGKETCCLSYAESQPGCLGFSGVRKFLRILVSSMFLMYEFVNAVLFVTFVCVMRPTPLQSDKIVAFQKSSQ